MSVVQCFATPSKSLSFGYSIRLRGCTIGTPTSCETVPHPFGFGLTGSTDAGVAAWPSWSGADGRPSSAPDGLHGVEEEEDDADVDTCNVTFGRSSTESASFLAFEACIAAL